LNQSVVGAELGEALKLDKGLRVIMGQFCWAATFEILKANKTKIIWYR
jgi:hypothetical protein